MATRTSKSPAGTPDEGRFFEIREELDKKRRGPYVLTKDIVINPITRRQAREIRNAKNEDEQLKIILGDNFDAVEALYDDLELDDWVEFQKDLQNHFYGNGATEVPGGSEGS
ncbi:hypothetical protein [Rhodococcoides fascians]|uniref:hypothetical protein n=1 Tax=Rhodococcoides fascians TaxID=1828 RepID=UPI00050CE05D|nr:hypothetical protein [Rhodococcus fascians]